MEGKDDFITKHSFCIAAVCNFKLDRHKPEHQHKLPFAAFACDEWQQLGLRLRSEHLPRTELQQLLLIFKNTLQKVKKITFKTHESDFLL